jgi:RNA polymerase sigma-70 factor (ECF subfamily)
LFFSQSPQLGEFVSQILAPDERYEEKELKQRITIALNSILPLYKDVLLWKYDHDMSVLEIAHKLAVTFKSAEAKLFRARKAFVEVFGTLP